VTDNSATEEVRQKVQDAGAAVVSSEWLIQVGNIEDIRISEISRNVSGNNHVDSAGLRRASPFPLRWRQSRSCHSEFQR